MRYTITNSLCNGLGEASVDVFLYGCDNPIKCKGCHNPELQEEPVESIDTDNIILEIDNKINKMNGFFNSLSIAYMGGEPTAKYNIEALYSISLFIRKKYPNIKQILYSWKTIEQLNKENFKTEYFDYGVLGRFEEDLFQDGMLPASSNQYIYNFETRTKMDNIKLWR